MPTLSRRTAITGGLAAIGLAAVTAVVTVNTSPPGPKSGAGTAAGRAAAATTPLVRSRFAPFVGETFSIRAAGGESAAVLAAVHDLAQPSASTDEQRFLLELHSERELADGIVTLRHPAAGDATLFISAFDARDDGVVRMQAVIDQSV